MKSREFDYPAEGQQAIKYVSMKGALVEKRPKDDPASVIQITCDDAKAGEYHAIVSLPIGTKVYKPKKGDGGFSGKAAMVHKIVAVLQGYRIIDVNDVAELNDNSLKLAFTVDKAVPESTPEAMGEIKDGLKSILSRHNNALGGDPVEDDENDDDDDGTDDDATRSDSDSDTDDDPFKDDEDGDDADKTEITLEEGKGVTGVQFTGTDDQILALQRSSASFYAQLEGICGRKTTVKLPNGETYKN